MPFWKNLHFAAHHLGNQKLDFPQARPESFRRGEGGEETKNVMFLELSPFGHYKEINQVHLPNNEKDWL